MQSVNFRELLKQNSTQIERPKALPVGHYYAVITGNSFDLSRQKQTPFARFMLKLEAPADDVDAEEINGIDVTRRELRKDYYITPGALYRLSDMLDAVVGDPERDLEERIPETRNVRVLIKVTQRENETKTEIFNDIDTIVAAS